MGNTDRLANMRAVSAPCVSTEMHQWRLDLETCDIRLGSQHPLAISWGCIPKSEHLGYREQAMGPVQLGEDNLGNGSITSEK